ncbi:MAG: tetratricopeptide repeat protein, partial [Pseudomonadota bacterium]
ERKKLFLNLLIGVCVLILIGLGVRWYFSYTASQALAIYNHALTDVSQPGDFEPKKAETAVKELEKLIQVYPGSKPARYALLDLGNLDFLLKQYDKSQKAYESFLNDLKPAEEPLKPLVLDSLANVYEAKGELAKAASTWEKIVTGSDILMKPEAYLGLGRVYQALKQTEKSKKAYQDLIAMFPQSEKAIMAKVKLADLTK